MNKQKSFTLIELLVVIVIIGILAGVIMISTSSSIDKANIAKVKVFEESVMNNLAANMISRWTLDEIIDTNKTPDQWGSNIGSLSFDSLIAGYGDNHTSGPLSEANCVSGTCFKFDGIDDSINCGTDSLSFGDAVSDYSFTFSAWINMTNRTNFIILQKPNEYLWTNNNHHRLYLYDNGTGNYIYRNATDLVKYLGQWIFLIAIYDGSKTIEGIKFYINGVETSSYGSGSAGTYIAMHKTTSNLSIGANFANGAIDDIKIYNAILSSSQIKQNYIAGLNSMLASGTISKEDYNERINALAYEQE
ncbi:MAG: prepilin-type N-terminal cleavage/methylation domain-containing protein [Candidatus Pacebacteria bacterium]|nr:prepilin-type N-terminal cleavage/methylation domain-containing protein [Candidatus Paceibacterota bacterium]